MSMDIETYQSLRLDQFVPAQVNGRSNADIHRSLEHPGDSVYHPCPEAYPATDVPRGEVTKFKDWVSKKVYPDTIRDIYLYRSPKLSADNPARLLICNDGAGYLARSGNVHAAAVLDSLVHNGELSDVVAVFINPGRPKGAPPFGSTTDYDAAATQRSLEYDSLTPLYGQFLIDEIIPWIGAQLGAQLSDKASDKIICGISSGGIAAFNAAWHFPQHFSRVISHCGSYTNIRGGHNYPYLVRTTPRKGLRVYLQSGENDATTLFGDWPSANLSMARALQYAGYDVRFDYGSGGHTLRHGGATFAETLRWLWDLQH